MRTPGRSSFSGEGFFAGLAFFMTLDFNSNFDVDVRQDATGRIKEQGVALWSSIAFWIVARSIQWAESIPYGRQRCGKLDLVLKINIPIANFWLVLALFIFSLKLVELVILGCQCLSRKIRIGQIELWGVLGGSRTRGDAKKLLLHLVHFCIVDNTKRRRLMFDISIPVTWQIVVRWRLDCWPSLIFRVMLSWHELDTPLSLTVINVASF